MYLLGMLGQNMIYNIVSTGLYFYFQNVIFVPAMALGIIMAIGRVWDAINDPIMGTIVDRTHSKWGKCRPYLIFAPAVIGIITILCFCNGIYTQASPTGQVLILVWMAVGYLMWDIAFTAADVPLWGITALMTDSEKDRSKILAFARIAAGIGVIENDFHDRPDLTPNVCAVYVEEAHRCRGIAGQMLQFVCADMKNMGIDTLYLVTDHTSFYERYGWEFLCMVQDSAEGTPIRMYVHRG